MILDTETLELIAYIVGGIVTLVGGTATSNAGLRHLKRWRNRARWEYGFEDISYMDRILERTRTKIHATEARLVQVHNTNGVPSPQSTAIYSTVVWETPRSPKQKIGWKEQPCDEHLRQIVMSLFSAPMTRLATSEMPDGTILKNLYDATGVECALVVKVGEDEGHMYYATFHYNRSCTLSPYNSETLRAFANEMRSVLGI